MENKIVIHTIARDEDHIINEWIVHHILIGFDHIHIYDDQSNVPISQTIMSLPDWIVKKVTVYRIDVDFYNKAQFKNSPYYIDNLYDSYCKYKQFYAFAHFLEIHKNSNIEWCFFGDADEFMCLNKYNTIGEFINDYMHMNIIYIPWLIYGNSYHIDQPTDYLVMDAFKYHMKEYYEMGKSLINIKTFEADKLMHFSPPHFGLPNLYNNDKTLYNIPVHINHYQINSVRKYLERKLRSEIGYANGQSRPPNEIYTFMLSYNDMYDNHMDKYIEQVVQILGKKRYVFEEKNYMNYLIIGAQTKEYDDIFELIRNNKQNITYGYLKSLMTNNIKFIEANETFDSQIETYKNLNPDLKHMGNNEIINHYLNHGIAERRTTKNPSIPSEFDVEIYKAINHDLSNMTNNEAINHYIKYGINENRIISLKSIPKEFDIIAYKTLNSDLSQMSDFQAKVHYLRHGKNENRRISFNGLSK